MIPNGKEIIIDGHKVVFESEPSSCRGCFYENRDSCPDCDDGIWVEEGYKGERKEREMSDKLKPCPFCGGEAGIRESSDVFSAVFYEARCKKCNVKVIVYADMTKSIEFNRQKVIEAWNKRANPWHTGIPTEEGWYLYEWGSTCESYATYRADTKEELAYLKDANKWQKIEPFEASEERE